MTWSSPPTAVSELRTMLVACASAVSAGLIQANVHYPAAVAGSDDATAVDSLPRAVLAETDHRRTRYAEQGVAALPGGTLEIHVQTAGPQGSLETLAQAIAAELQTQSTGLPITSAQAGLCSEPQQGQRARADDTGASAYEYFTCIITVEYGLSA